MQRIVLTGGPGAGKSTVLDLLRNDGYTVGEDAARCIMRERKAAGLSPRPAPRRFAELILEREIAAYRSAAHSPAFFDRGVAEAVGQLYDAGGLDDREARRLMAEFRYARVFLFPPWPDIYRMDAERDHTFEHAIRVCEWTRNWYLGFAYEIVEVPLCSAEDRARFILERAR